MTISFSVPLLPPSVNACWRKQKYGGFYLTKEANAFINAVGYLAPKTPLQKIASRKYEIRLVFKIAESRFLRMDLDNLLKISADSLAKAGIITDDRYIVRLSAEKVSVPKAENEATEYTVIGL